MAWSSPSRVAPTAATTALTSATTSHSSSTRPRALPGVEHAAGRGQRFRHVGDEHRDEERDADRAARRERDAEHERLRHAVEHGAERDREAAVVAGIPTGAVAVPPAAGAHQGGVAGGEDHGAEAEARDHRPQVGPVEGLLDQFERDGGDQRAGAEGHDRADGARRERACASPRGPRAAAPRRPRTPTRPPGSRRCSRHLRSSDPPRILPVAVLGGELAVPCYPRSASAGLNPRSRPGRSGAASERSVEGRVLRDIGPRTRSGPEGSSRKRKPVGAVGAPGWSCRS